MMLLIRSISILLIFPGVVVLSAVPWSNKASFRGDLLLMARQRRRRRPGGNNPSLLSVRAEANFWGRQQSEAASKNHHPPPTCAVLSLRGGEVKESQGFVVQKIRNVVRSLLGATNGTPLYTPLRKLLGGLESMFGVRLLPSKKTKPKVSITKKKTKKKRKKLQETTADATIETEATPESEKDDEEEESAKVGATTTATTTKRNNSQKKTKKKKLSKAAVAHLEKDIKSTNPNYRIQRELKAFIQDPPEHLTVKIGKNLRIWIVTIDGIGIYKGETFSLRIQFPPNYPTRPPSVYFLPPNIPVHEHVYTNGDICLSLLGKDWRPTMTAQSIAHSILSILASATSKSLPMDNARHSQNKPGEYQDNWVYHDDLC